MTIDMSQFYQVFFEEAGEHLANMESLLLALDVENPSNDELNAIFRAAHSIKGGSGTFGFTDMTEVTHILETLLDRLRKSELTLRPEMVDAFLAAGDILRGQLEHHQGGPAVDEAEVRAVCDTLASLSSDAPQSRRLWLACMVPGELSDDEAGRRNLIDALSEIASVEVVHMPEAGDPRFTAWLTTTARDADILDMLSFHAFPEDIVLSPSGPAQSNQVEEAYGFFDGLPDAEQPGQEEAYGLFEPVEAAPESTGTSDDDGFGFFEDAPGRPEFPHEQEVKSMDSPAAIEGEGYGLFIDAPGGMGLFENAPGTGAMRTGVTESKSVKSDSPSPGRRASDNPTLDRVPTGRRVTDKVAVGAGSEASSIRVSVEKVDQLINLVGELVITQAMIADAAGYLDPVQAEKLLSGIDLLSRNTRDLQESVMSIRMLPMSMVFSRFPRVVRDLAGKLGKQVELRTFGESTELDKGLIEKITDPLTHLIRNSLDHGIEMPDRRIAAGKSPKGTVTLKASHQGGNIVIEVMDDGAGLNRERLLAKALERGLNVHDGMSDSEVWQLIFAPGFSTAEMVTDVSGRGVGMDVVKKNIEGLGGRVELESGAGLGTRTIIRLPLTLAILDGMSVGVAGEIFIVPLTAIIESLQPRGEDIKTVAGDSRVVHIRGEYLPIVPLAEVFGCAAETSIERGIFVVVEAEAGKAALFVDELLGQHQVVIKSLEANYRKVPGTSGATIMGDGSVAMILDVAAVIRMGMASRRGMA